MPAEISQREYMSIKEVSEKLCVSISTVQQLICSKSLPALAIRNEAGNRAHYRIHMDDLAAFIEKSRTIKK